MMAISCAVEARALLSRGSSSWAIYQMVMRAMRKRNIMGGTIIDVGCGGAHFFPFIQNVFTRVIGIDVARYDGVPPEVEFHQADLGNPCTSLPDAIGDVVASLETIEHLENPRALFRELCRLARPGGWIIITTPNQLSFLSLATLICKRQFNHFQETSYPAHLTALLEIDLTRMALECGLLDVAVEYSLQGRIIGTAWHYPGVVSRLWPRMCSDNVLLIGRKPE
jgi:SAM-dependent methyltransferase